MPRVLIAVPLESFLRETDVPPDIEPELLSEDGPVPAGDYTAEPRISGRLRVVTNAVLLPHLGSATEEARRGMWELAWANLVNGVRGEPLLTPVPGS